MRKVLGFLAIALLLFLALLQRQQSSRVESRLAEAERTLSSATHALSDADRKIQQLEEQKSALEQQLVEQASETAILKSSIAKSNPPPASAGKEIAGTDQSEEKTEFDPKGMMKSLQKMMKDPAMKEMLRSQQKATVNMMYGSLMKDLNLSAEEKDKFVELMSENQSSALDNSEALFDTDPASRTNAVEALKEREKKLEQDLRAILGDERFAQYADYKGGLGERMQLNQFKQQSADTEWALNDDQTKQLLQLMKEERTRQPAVAANDPSEPVKNLEMMMSEEAMERQLQSQHDLNQRVLERSRQILSEQQVTQLATFQEQQMNMQRMGLRMARQMFGTNANRGTNAVSP
jgi:hypothetical protein